MLYIKIEETSAILVNFSLSGVNKTQLKIRSSETYFLIRLGFLAIYSFQLLQPFSTIGRPICR